MKTKPEIRRLGSLLVVGWLSLSGCARLASSPPKQAAPSPPDLVVDRLLMDIMHAREIEQRKPGMPAPEESFTYEYGTDADHRPRRFANLRAYRLDIKHRMDSLRVAGRVVRYDTLVTDQGPVGKMKID